MSIFDMLDNNDLLNEGIANEAISFNANPKLASRLDAMFQSIIDYRDNLNYDKVGGNISGSSKVREYRKEQVLKFAMPLLTKTLPDIVTQETGLLVGKVFVETNKPSCMFAVDLSMGDPENVLPVIETVVGTGDAPAQSKKISKILQSGKWLDLSTGKFDNTKSPFKIKIDLYFDAIVAFLINDYVHDSIQIPTAKELTAVELHEIGHAITITERFGHTYFTLNDINNTVNSLSKQLSPIEMLSSLKNDVVPCVNRLMSQNKLSKNIGDSVIQCINKLVEVFDSDSVAIGKLAALLLFAGAVAVCYKVILNWVAVLSFGISAAITAPFCIRILLITFSGVNTELVNAEAHTKRSDTMVTRHNVYSMERDADDYVVRMGYGDHLVSLLNRFDQLSINSLIGYQNVHFKNSYLNLYGMKLLMFTLNNLFISNIITMNFGEQNNASPYEKIDNRIRRVAQDAIELFKNKDIPAPIRDNYLSNYNNILKQLKITGASEYTKPGNMLFRLLVKATPAELIKMVTSGKLTAEYEVVLNKMEDLKRNTMYINAAKLAQLAEKA